MRESLYVICFLIIILIVNSFFCLFCVKVSVHNAGHLASTYCALAILRTIGFNISTIDKESILISMRNLQQPDGRYASKFKMQFLNDIDRRNLLPRLHRDGILIDSFHQLCILLARVIDYILMVFLCTSKEYKGKGNKHAIKLEFSFSSQF